MEKEVSQPRRPGSGDASNGKIDFKPLTQGLGFHPFSDGLPYAPISKTGTPAGAPPASAGGGNLVARAASARVAAASQSGTMGTGATAAGPATFLPGAGGMALPRRGVMAAPAAPPAGRSASRVHVPTAQPLHSGHATGPLLTPIAPAIPGRYTPALPGMSRSTPASFAAAESLAASSVAGASLGRRTGLGHPGIEPEYTYTYSFKRVLAYGLDTALNVALSAAALSLALWNQNLNPDLLVNPAVLFISVLFFAMFNWALVTAQEIIFGTSFGKRVFRLALQGSTSAILLRAFFFLPSLGFAGLGLAWALFDPQRRCWHDLVVDLQPLEIAKL